MEDDAQESGTITCPVERSRGCLRGKWLEGGSL